MSGCVARMLTILVLLSVTACASGKPNQVMTIPAGALVLTDDDLLVKSACDQAHGSLAAGCYNAQTKTIYCSRTHLSTCGHELLLHVGLRREDF
jgi:hypothetical protein